MNDASRTLRYVLTAKDGDARLSERPPLVLTLADQVKAPDGLAQVMVSSSKRFQRMEGFGGAFTEAAAVTWQRLPPAQQDALLRDYFDARQGHGYRLCRVHINSCDFSTGNYAHAAMPGDLALEHFSIERDRQALLPMLKAAQQVAGAEGIKLLASPWSPPPWMKSNGQMNNGGTLLPECAAAWAQCFVKFIQAYAEEGVPIWGVSVQNEPDAAQRWDSCIYSAEAERDFVRDYLGPALAAAGLGHVRIVIWDHNRDLMVERAHAIYSDPQAAAYVWGCGFHWYVEDAFEHVQQLHDAWPDKQLLFTEGCQEGGTHTGEWELGERYGRSMINDLQRWTVGWIDWNLLLDASGGPNHVGNLCSAPMLANAGGTALEPQSSYHYIGHFARYIRPGSERILCAATRQVLESTAFLNTDGEIAVVVMNRSEEGQRFSLLIDGRRALVDLPPRAIATYLCRA
ncbi:MAG TPA: glycoside hydrolase family 30 protein [Burkholderiaceae bacterium]